MCGENSQGIDPGTRTPGKEFSGSFVMGYEWQNLWLSLHQISLCFELLLINTFLDVPFEYDT